MEQQFCNPLLKIGSFLTILSYYDYSHRSVILGRRLSKQMREITNKWENALNENCTRIAIRIQDENYKIMKTRCKFRELKHLDLEIEIRRTESISAFLELLKYFDKIRDSDILELSKACEGDSCLDKSKYAIALPKYYLHIMKINSIPLKRSEEIAELAEKLTNLFELPAKLSPNSIVIPFNGNNDENPDDYFNNNFIPAELESKLKYNQNYDILHFNLNGYEKDLEMFLSNEKYEAKRLKIETSNPLNDDAANCIVNNKNHSQILEYLHLMIPQKTNEFF